MTRRAAVRTLAASGLVTTVTVALAGQPAEGAFGGVTGSAGNQVATAAEFCSAPGSTTLSTSTQVVDTWINEGGQDDTAGGQRDLYVRSSNGANARALVRFPTMPSIPAGCAVSSATLRLAVSISTTGRTIGVHRISPTAVWSESSVTWRTQPAVTADAPVTGSPGASGTTQAWTVTDLVRAQYAQGNTGFLLRDQSENAASPTDLRYRSREDGLPPQLTVSWS